RLDYTICEVLNPGNCSDAATVTVEVTAAEIEAMDDTGDEVDASTGGTVQLLDGGDLNVLNNDLLNGEEVAPAEVILATVTAPTPVSGGIVMKTDGTVVVAEGTTPGNYSYPYTICELLNPTNCASAAIKVVVKPVGVADERVTEINTPVISNVNANDGVSATGTTVAIDTDGEHGTAAVNADGSVTYMPGKDFIGKDTYTYILETADGVVSEPVTVTVQVKPVGVDDDITVDANSSVTPDVVDNDGPS